MTEYKKLNDDELEATDKRILKRQDLVDELTVLQMEQGSLGKRLTDVQSKLDLFKEGIGQ